MHLWMAARFACDKREWINNERQAMQCTCVRMVRIEHRQDDYGVAEENETEQKKEKLK